jgi:hypothetical protein
MWREKKPNFANRYKGKLHDKNGHHDLTVASFWHMVYLKPDDLTV